MLRRMIRVMLLPIVGAIALFLLAGSASAAPRVPNGIPFSSPVIPEGALCPDFPSFSKALRRPRRGHNWNAQRSLMEP